MELRVFRGLALKIIAGKPWRPTIHITKPVTHNRKEVPSEAPIINERHGCWVNEKRLLERSLFLGDAADSNGCQLAFCSFQPFGSRVAAEIEKASFDDATAFLLFRRALSDGGAPVGSGAAFMYGRECAGHVILQ
jgi:hypothetical protein